MAYNGFEVSTSAKLRSDPYIYTGDLPRLTPETYSSTEIFLSPHECADTIRVHEQTIKRWVRLGILPAYGHERCMRIRLADLLSLYPGYNSRNPIAREKRTGKARVSGASKSKSFVVNTDTDLFPKGNVR